MKKVYILIKYLYLPQGTHSPLLEYKPVLMLSQSKQYSGDEQAKHGETHNIQA